MGWVAWLRDKSAPFPRFTSPARSPIEYQPPENPDPKAERDALLTKVHYPGAPAGFYVPGPEFTPKSVGVLDATLTGYTIVRGTQNPLLPAAPGVPEGGRVFTISAAGQKFTKTIFECAVTFSGTANLSNTTFEDCWIAGPNPDQIVWERQNYPRRNAAGTVQWTTSACLTNFTNSTVYLNDCTVSSLYYLERGRATRASTPDTPGLWGAKFRTYRIHIYGTTDSWNQNGVKAVIDGTSEHTLGRFGPNYFANRLVPSPYNDVQGGGYTHSDALQTNIGRFGKMRRCYIGGPHVKSVESGGPMDPGPIGQVATDAYNAAMMFQQELAIDNEARVDVDGIDIEDCWIAGGTVGLNANYSVSKGNRLPAPGLEANRIGNRVTKNRFMAISSTNTTSAGIYASNGITMDMTLNVWWVPTGDPRGNGVTVPIIRRADEA